MKCVVVVYAFDVKMLSFAKQVAAGSVQPGPLKFDPGPREMLSNAPLLLLPSGYQSTLRCVTDEFRSTVSAFAGTKSMFARRLWSRLPPVGSTPCSESELPAAK